MLKCKANGLVLPVLELALIVNGVFDALFNEITLFGFGTLIIKVPDNSVSPTALATTVSGNSIPFNTITVSADSTAVKLNDTKYIPDEFKSNVEFVSLVILDVAGPLFGNSTGDPGVTTGIWLSGCNP